MACSKDSALEISSSAKEVKSDDVYRFKLLIPSEVVGPLIGPDGDIMKRLESESKCRIALSRPHDYYPETQERVCLLKGTMESILSTNDFIMERVSALVNDSEINWSIRKKRNMRLRANHVLCLIPQSSVPRLIGKNGWNIERVKRQTNTHIQISQIQTDIALQERSVAIAGDRENINLACKIIIELMGDDTKAPFYENTSYGYTNAPLPNANPTGAPLAKTIQLESSQEFSFGASSNNQSSSCSFTASINMNDLFEKIKGFHATRYTDMALNQTQKILKRLKNCGPGASDACFAMLLEFHFPGFTSQNLTNAQADVSSSFSDVENDMKDNNPNWEISHPFFSKMNTENTNQLQMPSSSLMSCYSSDKSTNEEKVLNCNFSLGYNYLPNLNHKEKVMSKGLDDFADPDSVFLLPNVREENTKCVGQNLSAKSLYTRPHDAHPGNFFKPNIYSSDEKASVDYNVASFLPAVKSSEYKYPSSPAKPFTYPTASKISSNSATVSRLSSYLNTNTQNSFSNFSSDPFSYSSASNKSYNSPAVSPMPDATNFALPVYNGTESRSKPAWMYPDISAPDSTVANSGLHNTLFNSAVMFPLPSSTNSNALSMFENASVKSVAYTMVSNVSVNSAAISPFPSTTNTNVTYRNRSSVANRVTPSNVPEALAEYEVKSSLPLPIGRCTNYANATISAEPIMYNSDGKAPDNVRKNPFP